MVTISIPKSGECEIDASLKRITNFRKKNQCGNYNFEKSGCQTPVTEK